ncbi:hypothetical protein [Alkalihalobacterium bogoriense]|uniref:hypothetical protein n=1 Tax=Alkalihalobacterium bogoriense TaxID=246272 RepID=UPI00047939EC|nr:hypothetical protein [Alkalihalobacterium bogoriense]
MTIYLKNAKQVRLVKNVQQAKEYYSNVLGFSVDCWGHAKRDNVGFLLQQADKPEHIHPNEKATYLDKNWAGPPMGWDTYCYSTYDEVLSLYDEYTENGAIIAYEPIKENMGNQEWIEFAVRDLDGYVIVFGGGKPKKGV